MAGEPTTDPTRDPPFEDGTPLTDLDASDAMEATFAMPLFVLDAPFVTLANDNGLSSGKPWGMATAAACGDTGTGVDIPDILAEYTEASSRPLSALAVCSCASVRVWWIKRHLVP